MLVTLSGMVIFLTYIVLTSTSHVAVRSPSTVVTLITLVPSPTAVTIKEAAEKPWNYWFLLISGIVFSLFFVVCVIGMIVDYFC